jgi:hypothetical protein
MWIKKIALGALACVGMMQPLLGSTSATATVTYNIQAIDSISVSGNPPTLSILTATPGSHPTDAADNTTTYAVTTNSATARAIQGSLSSDLPAGVRLCVTLQAPTNATSVGSVELSSTNANLVTGISQVAEGSLTISYTLCATPSAAVTTSNETVTVTFTLG